ncbi:MAG: DUF3046 domain-containing protein [Actinomycetaceae bacterium]|nr:DUF3046 domain-containing protein [Actinomycetaceae bacterium]
MRRSEFWDNVDQVYGSTYGRSLVADLALSPWYQSATQLLEQGEDPQKIWEALVEQTGIDPEMKWFHRFAKKRAVTN